MKRWIFILKLLLVLAMLLFIWGHSMVPGDVSNMESGTFLRLVRPAVEAVRRFFEARGYSYSQEYLVRKMAHFTEYAVLGVLMLVLFLRSDLRVRLLPPAAACLTVAFIDEGIQIYAAGRGPALRDVALDFCGACAGMLLASLAVLIVWLLTRPRGRHEA